MPLLITNPSRHSTLADRAERARGFLPRLRGLMFRPALGPGEGLLLEPESSIHTFFMRCPIDVLYLTKEGQVLRAEAAMPPSRVGPLHTRGCHAILELPAGTIDASQTEVGDTLHIEAHG